MANAHARLARRGLIAQERWLTNPVAGAPVFRWPMKSATEEASNAASFVCVPSMLERGVEIVVGGNPVTIALTLMVRRDLFHTADSLWSSAAEESEWTAADAVPLPSAGKVLQFKGVAYRILLVADAGDHSHLKITLGDLNSGR